jgi:hypothetical protein
MDLSRTRVVLRERAVVDVLDLAVRFVVEHGALYAKTTLLATAPFFAASLVIGFYGGWLFGWLFSLFVAPLAGAPFTALASRLVFEDAVRPGDALRAAARQIPTLLVLRVSRALRRRGREPRAGVGHQGAHQERTHRGA